MKYKQKILQLTTAQKTQPINNSSKDSQSSQQLSAVRSSYQKFG